MVVRNWNCINQEIDFMTGGTSGTGRSASLRHGNKGQRRKRRCSETRRTGGLGRVSSEFRVWIYYELEHHPSRRCKNMLDSSYRTCRETNNRLDKTSSAGRLFSGLLTDSSHSCIVSFLPLTYNRPPRPNSGRSPPTTKNESIYNSAVDAH